jgi:hypothetical protein
MSAIVINVLVALGSLLGAASWIPFIVERFFVRGRISGRIISCVLFANQEFFNNDTSKKYSGIGYFFGISLLALNKNIFCKDIKVNFFYASDPLHPYDAIIFTPPIGYSFRDKSGIEFRLVRSKVINNMLKLSPVIEKSNVSKKYLACIVPDKKFENFEKMVIKFIDFKNKEKITEFKWSDLDWNNISPEEDVWEKLR